MAETEMASSQPQKLDDVMIAMDIVDTLRHRDDLVSRELNEKGREADLISRLRQIYRDQGIEVPDDVIAEGVKALKDSRFEYTPYPPGWKRTFLILWVKREIYGKRLLMVLAALIVIFGGYHLFVIRPAKIAEEQARIEINETLPKEIRQTHAEIMTIGVEEAAKQKATSLLSEGERAIKLGDRPAMTRINADLASLKDELKREYALTIVSRPGESSGVWRRPPHGNQTRNYYLIVEAITFDGAKLNLPIRNEETGVVETVPKFGVRVPEATFEAVARDKRDDGIVQKNRFGLKKRGMVTVDYQMPFEGGFLTNW